MTGNTEAPLIEFTALALLAGAGEPVGSARLAEAWRRAGIPMAEATAGRYLRRLDERGLTRSMGAKLGRVITDAGQQRLAQLRLSRRLDEHGARVLGAVKATEIEELIDLLYVRRAVEAEAARLAAQRATDDELARIAALSSRHIDDVCSGCDIVEPSMHFHRLVAEASHNRMLVAVALLLLDPANDPLAKALGQIALDTGDTPDHAADHVALALALRTRDAPAAEGAMRTHLDKLIRTVEAYRERTPE